jgi:hypothetical protein
MSNTGAELSRNDLGDQVQKERIEKLRALLPANDPKCQVSFCFIEFIQHMPLCHP